MTHEELLEMVELPTEIKGRMMYAQEIVDRVKAKAKAFVDESLDNPEPEVYVLFETMALLAVAEYIDSTSPCQKKPEATA
jgi:hypothetical protein